MSQWNRDYFVQQLNIHKAGHHELACVYYETLIMFMDGAVEPSQYAARFTLLRRRMKDDVDFFCKSGEDRTGRFCNLLEELCEFRRLYGHYPRYDLATKSIAQDDLLKQQSIAKKVSEFSVSRDINDQNAHGARGLQISSFINVPIIGKLSNAINFGLANKSGDYLAKLAKSIYSTLKLQAWYEFLFGGPSKEKQHLLDAALKPLAANHLLAENLTDVAGFTTRIIAAEGINDSVSLAPAPPSLVEVQTRVKPTYRGVRLKPSECLVAEKSCQLASAEHSTVIGRIVYTGPGCVRNITALAPEQELTAADNIALAMQQAIMLLRPPFTPKKGPIILSGADDKQVARTHAALLFLKDAHASLQNLQIIVKGQSVRPQRAGRWESKNRKNREFIVAQLGEAYHADGELVLQKKELTDVIKAQQGLKTLLKADQEQGTLNLLPGQKLQ